MNKKTTRHSGERLAAPPDSAAVKAAELEIAANYIRGQKACDAPIGCYVQKAIDEALEQHRIATGRG